MDNESASKISLEIEKLVKSYRDLKKSKKDDTKEMAAVSEANVRADYVDRLFGILGWDIGNPDEYDREHFIRGAGFADIALKVNNKPVIFVEAKRFGAIPHSKDVKGDWTLDERQAILYAAGKHCKWAVLTNFEKFRVFNALTGLTVLSLESVDDYKNRLWDIIHLTKDFVVSDKIERLGAREEKEPIDRQFLELLNRWRRELANDIYLNNFLNEGKPPDLSKLFPDYKKHEHDPRYRKFFESRREMLRKRLDFSALKDEKGSFDIEKQKSAVQRILDRLIIIRWAEDHLLLEDSNILEGRLKLYTTAGRYNPLYEALFANGALFDKFNDIHNGEIFRRGLYYDRITVSDDVLKRIIEEMTSYSFRKFDFDILGNTYETYLGNTLYLKDDNTFDLKPSQETRKESGIYYTPPYVVDYIVKNTLGALLSDKKPEEIARIKVLDPACGSGSFLIKAYDCFANYYEEKNREIKKRIDKKARTGKIPEHDEETYAGYEASILMNNIHGVDLDAQAAEIAAVNLMLKALKPNEMLPPILGETIKVGNSLISGSEEELKKYFGDEWRTKKPFNWEEEFAAVFDKALPEGEKGFDVVIGNPPWVSFGLRGVGKVEKELDDFVREKYPNSAEYKLSVYGIFMNRAIDLMADKAIFGFIVPDSFLLGRYFSKLRRYILDKARIIEILMIVEDFWPHGNVGRSVIILLQKERNENGRKNNDVVVKLCGTLDDLHKKNFKTYSYKQNYFETIPYNRFRMFFDKLSKDFVDKREEDTIHLKEIVSIHTGVRSKIGQKNIIDKEKKGETWKKGLISGSEIGKYHLKWDGYFINIEPSILWGGGWDPDVVLNDKLIMRQTGDSIYATFNSEKYYHLNNCHSISLKNSSYNLKYIL
ncbi:MAG: N-6 DNA methylase, partial [Candidatus Methanoperedenaceae archaeon]|nr:N-6 DNA methylase [Candidatus Methanoperedenaceae archaeon]